MGLTVLVAAAGCDRGRLAVVGDTTLRDVDLAAFLSVQSRAEPLAKEEALDALVSRTLLAEGARRRGLGNEPAIRARIAAAEREILAQALLENVLDGAGDDAAVRARYDERTGELARRRVHVQHIVVRVSDPRDAHALAEGRRRINEVYAKLVAGESFDELARSASDDPATAAKGGELPPILEGQVDATFFSKAAELKQGQYSKPFETGFGFHVVKALEDLQTVTPTFDELKGRLAAEARLEAQAKLLERLRSEISVTTHPERLGASQPKVDSREGAGR